MAYVKSISMDKEAMDIIESQGEKFNLSAWVSQSLKKQFGGKNNGGKTMRKVRKTV